MTKIVEYQCNLCRTKRHANEMSGIYWTSSTQIDMRDSVSCDNHVCEFCIEAIQNAVRKRKGREERAIAP